MALLPQLRHFFFWVPMPPECTSLALCVPAGPCRPQVPPRRRNKRSASPERDCGYAEIFCFDMGICTRKMNRIAPAACNTGGGAPGISAVFNVWGWVILCGIKLLRGQLCGLLLLTMTITKERHKTEQNETATIDPHSELKCGRVCVWTVDLPCFVAVDPNQHAPALSCLSRYINQRKQRRPQERRGRQSNQPRTKGGKSTTDRKESTAHTAREREREDRDGR